MRKGFSLIEILVVLVLFSAVSVVMAQVFATLVSDIPRSYRVVQTNTNVLGMLSQMQKDIDAAKGLPGSFAGHTTSDEVLFIELADGMVCYQLKDGQVLRHEVSRQMQYQQGSYEDTRDWLVPNAKVQWQVWKKDDKGYAVEVKTHVEHNVRGRWQKKMANSHLYFVGAFREANK